MPPTGSTFTDWQQVERESLLFNDADFNWSEPPQRRRRRIIEEPIRPRHSVAVIEPEPELPDADLWIGRLDVGRPADRAFNLSDPGTGSPAQGGRRAIVIRGHGDERYPSAPRRRHPAELRFHERSGFSPDRAGLWAVLLSLTLVIACIVH
jgi:hypothetical protein